MTTFDDREKAYENRYVHDQELAFRAVARRNKKFGQWAAAQLGRSGGEAQAYVEALLVGGLGPEGSEAVFARVKSDFAAAGIALSDHQIRREMDRLLSEATAEVKSE